MKVNLKFLSEKSGLSTTAVSLILNNKEVRVSDEKRKLVLELAEKYNYMPNSMAVGLVTQKTKTVGFIIPDITNLFFAEIAKKVEHCLNKNGYSLILCNTNDNKDLERKYVGYLLNKGIDALIVCVTSETLFDSSFLDSYKKNDIPCVAFDRWSPEMECSSVSIDNMEGAYSAVTYLLNHGHRKIGCITGPIEGYSAKMRLEGYKKALNEWNLAINENYIAVGDYQFESGYIQGKKLLNSDITAVFVSNDLMAYGFYKAVREMEKKIPDDISVIGFDDLFFSNMIEVPLTSVRQNVDELADKICSMVLDSINGKKSQEHIFLPTTITERSSVKKLENMSE